MTKYYNKYPEDLAAVSRAKQNPSSWIVLPAAAPPQKTLVSRPETLEKFLVLPIEVRQKIYSYLEPVEDNVTTPRPLNLRPILLLMQSCRQLYHGIGDFLYCNRTGLFARNTVLFNDVVDLEGFVDCITRQEGIPVVAKGKSGPKVHVFRRVVINIGCCPALITSSRVLSPADERADTDEEWAHPYTLARKEEQSDSSTLDLRFAQGIERLLSHHVVLTLEIMARQGFKPVFYKTSELMRMFFNAEERAKNGLGSHLRVQKFKF